MQWVTDQVTALISMQHVYYMYCITLYEKNVLSFKT